MKINSFHLIRLFAALQVLIFHTIGCHYTAHKISSMGTLEIESKLEKLKRYTFVPYFYLFLTGILLQKMEAYRLSEIKFPIRVAVIS